MNRDRNRSSICTTDKSTMGPFTAAFPPPEGKLFPLAFPADGRTGRVSDGAENCPELDH